MHATIKFLTRSVLLFVCVLAYAFPLAQISPAQAAACAPTHVTDVRITPATFGSGTVSEVQIIFNGSFLDSTEEYALMVFDNKLASVPEERTGYQAKSSEMVYKFTSTDALTSDDILGEIDRHNIYLYGRSAGPLAGHANSICLLGTYDVEQGKLSCDRIEVIQQRNGQACYDSCVELGKDVIIKATGIKRTFSNATVPYDGILTVALYRGVWATDHKADVLPAPAGSLTYGIPGSDISDTSELKLNITGHYVGNNGDITITGCSNIALTARPSCANQCQATPQPVPVPNPGGGNPPVPNPAAQPGKPDTFDFCSQINDVNLRIQCTECAEGVKGYAGVWTAIGCIKRDPEAIVRKLMIVGLSTGGGVALLTFLAAGFLLSTSQGNTQQTDQAKQMITAATTGLLFILFSVTILEYIGYSILGIPGFGG